MVPTLFTFVDATVVTNIPFGASFQPHFPLLIELADSPWPLGRKCRGMHDLTQSSGFVG